MHVLTFDAFEAFSHCSILDKALFCLGQKQGMLQHVYTSAQIQTNLKWFDSARSVNV